MSGWFEILLRFEAIDFLRSLNELDQDDYMMVGCRMPLSEFSKVHEVYSTLVDGEFSGMPRPLQEYNIINMVYQRDKCDEMRVCNMLLIDDSNGKNDHLLDPAARLLWLKEGCSLVLLPLIDTHIPSKFRE